MASVITKLGAETKQKYHCPEKHNRKMKKPGERLPTVGLVPNALNMCLRVQRIPFHLARRALPCDDRDVYFSHVATT